MSFWSEYRTRYPKRTPEEVRQLPVYKYLVSLDKFIGHCWATARPLLIVIGLYTVATATVEFALYIIKGYQQ